MTDKEDAAITASARADPDAQPSDALLLRRKTGKRLPVQLRRDRKVVDSFESEGQGCQTRMSEALRKAVGRD